MCMLMLEIELNLFLPVNFTDCHFNFAMFAVGKEQ